MKMLAILESLFKKVQSTKRRCEVEKSCSPYQEIMLQYQGKHIIYKLQQGLITYKNVISPRDGGRHFPEGYFNVKTVEVPENTQNEILKMIDAVLSQLTFEDTLALLPPGASHEAVIKCTKNTGENVYYSNKHLNENGFSIHSESVPALFLGLFNLLSTFCEFVPEFEPVSFNAHDDRYFSETLWVCENCSAGNLMEHRHCIKCGSPRPW